MDNVRLTYRRQWHIQLLRRLGQTARFGCGDEDVQIVV